MSLTARKLTLEDIADAREYEREREDFRQEVIQLKRLRRISVGPLVTLVFENRQTIRFQIQEMARIEKLMTDQAIQAELDVYNPLIPEPGTLQATLLLDLTSKELLLEWLPKLVGIERTVQIRIGEGDAVDVVSCIPESAHEAQLTRADTTASVHYIGFELSPEQVERFATEPVTVAVDHDQYIESAALSRESIAELLTDLRP